jgi:hypothetical protein
MDSGENSHMVGDFIKSKPIVDFFPEVTIMFADIVGFMAWSSMREPWQVFTLLETLYIKFVEIARRFRVFKVETIGDFTSPYVDCLIQERIATSSWHDLPVTAFATLP